MPAYTWLTLSQAVGALAARLADPGMVFWAYPELVLYLQESLRTWASLTEVWNADFAFSGTPAGVWYNLGAMNGSPRLRTVTDSYLYTVMEYQLLEPASGSVWTGTSQFALADLQFALQRRRDQMIQEAGCNVVPLPYLASTPNTRRTTFTDTTLEPRRARFLPDSSSGKPVTMNREDNLTWDSFQPSHLQQSGTPANWSVIAGPPLAMDVDVAPNVAGQFDVIALQSGPIFSPPGVSQMGVPDDWTWVAKWGALSDLLGRDSEATDRERADYCLKRFTDGLKAMAASNWLLLATINGVAVDTPSLREMDGFSPEWQDNPSAWPGLVTAGMDLVAPCPVTNCGVSCTLVGNAPVPVNATDYVQVSRDTWDVILDYAQAIASFKMGGAEFAATKDLEANFFGLAVETNKRLAKMGLFSDTLHLEGKKQDIAQPR